MQDVCFRTQPLEGIFTGFGFHQQLYIADTPVFQQGGYALYFRTSVLKRCKVTINLSTSLALWLCRKLWLLIVIDVTKECNFLRRYVLPAAA